MYWSSSEIDSNRAWSQSFSDGLQFNSGKFVTLGVRAVRAFPTVPTHAIGETGPGGGLVFLLDPATVGPDGRATSGLEAAPLDLEDPNSTGAGDFIIPWGCWDTDTGATGTAVGDGVTNSATILAANCPTAQGIDGAPAVEAANAYSNNGFTDWFLPSKDELNEMWINIGQGGDGANQGVFDSNKY